MRPVLPSFSLCAAVLLLSPQTGAQANYDAALIGGRSSLFGGTGVATGTDSAAPLQNPATIVDIEGASFVFSTLFLQLSQQKFNGNEDEKPGAEIKKGTSDLSTTVFRVLPNSTCLFLDVGEKKATRAGKHKLSVCIAEQERQEFTGSASGTYSYSGQTWYRDRDISYLYSKRVYAGSWAYAPSKQLSFGITPMLQEITYRDRESLATLAADATSQDQLIGAPGTSKTTQMSQVAHGFSGSVILGAQFRPSKDFQVGISVESPSFHIFGTYEATRSAENIFNTDEQYSQETGEARFQYPLRLALGLAKKWSGLAFEISSYFHSGRDDFAVTNGTRAAATIEDGVVRNFENGGWERRERVVPTANLGLGVEVPVAREWSLLFGVLSDFSGLEARKSGALSDSTLFRNQVDLVHGSVGVGWTPALGSILFGVRGFYGNGGFSLSSGASAASERVVLPETLWGLSLVLSGQLSLEMLAVVDPTGLLEKETKKNKAAENSASKEASPPTEHEDVTP